MSFHFVFAAVVFVDVKKSQIYFLCLRNFLSDTETSEVSPSVPAPVYPTLPLRYVGENQMMDDHYMLKYASAFLVSYVHVIMHTQQHPASASLSFKVSKFLFREAKDLISRSICLPLVCSCVKFTSGDLCHLVPQSLLSTSVKAFLFSEATKDLASGSD